MFNLPAALSTGAATVISCAPACIAGTFAAEARVVSVSGVPSSLPARSSGAPSPTAPAASPSPSADPSPTAAPMSKPSVPYVRFVAADLLLGTRVANAFAPLSTGSVTQDVRAALEYRFLGRNFIEVEYRRFRYAHPANDATRFDGAACPARSNDPGCVTQLGDTTSAYVRPARLSEQQFELHSSLIGRGHAYLATSAFARVASYGYPRLRSEFGFGAELLPALERPFSFSAAYYYYPEVRGTYALPSEVPARLRYKLETFDLRAHVSLSKTPLFLEIGFYGDRYMRKENAPSDATHRAFDLGFGVHV